MEQIKNHYKMYKKGKHILFLCVMTSSVSMALLGGLGTVQADISNSNNTEIKAFSSGATTSSPTANGDLTDSNSSSPTANGDLINSNSSSPTANGDLINSNSSSPTANGDLTDSNSSSSTANGDLINSNSSSSTANGDLINSNSSSPTANGDLTDSNSSSSTANGDLINSNSSSPTANGDLINSNSSSPTANGDLINSNSSSPTANGDLINSNSSSPTANGDLINSNSSSSTSNGDLINSNSSSTANGDLINSNSSSSTANGDLTDSNSSSSTANSDLTDSNSSSSTANGDLIDSSHVSQQNIIDKINKLMNQANWYSVNANELDEYVFLRNDVNYKINLNAPNLSDNLMVANHVIDITSNTDNTYSYTRGSAQTSGFGYIDTAPTEIDSTENDESYSVSKNNNFILVKHSFESNGIQVSEKLLVNDSGYIVHKVSFKNISDAQLAPRKYYALLDTMLNDNDYIPIYKDNHAGAFISDDDILLYTNMISNGDSYALDWKNRSNQDSDVLINDSNNQSAIVNNKLLNQNVKVIKENVDTAIRYVTPTIALLPQESIDLFFTESVFSKQEIKNIKATDPNKNFSDYFIQPFVEKFIPTDNNKSHSEEQIQDGLWTYVKNEAKEKYAPKAIGNITDIDGIRSNIKVSKQYYEDYKDYKEYKDCKDYKKYFKGKVEKIKEPKSIRKAGGLSIIDDSMKFLDKVGLINKVPKPKLSVAVKGLGIADAALTVIDDVHDISEIVQGTSTDQKEYNKLENNNTKYSNAKGSVTRKTDATIYAWFHKIWTGIMGILSNAGSLISKFIGVVFGPLGLLGGMAASLLVSIGVVALGKWLWDKYVAKRVREWITK
ncbi:KxYKxGKxW signal peptide domain-containing protein [Leuconostoc mesenteroides]|nr:KxYKxGKxW signal peptide domain-containing protein [Leuconostoc mesenteroides]